MVNETILSIKNLTVNFVVDKKHVEILHNVSFDLFAGKTLGLVGESGSGKSVTAMSIMGLLPKPYGQITNGEIFYKGIDLLKISKKERYKIRGNNISVIFQDPMTALNPVHNIGRQIEEVLLLHRPELDKRSRYSCIVEMLEKVKIPLPEKRIREYPHNLSGGMRQRIIIAMALACRPDILICDEPTTALDVTVQASILNLIKELQSNQGTAVIFITHDLGVVAEMCDDVAVMYQGRICEKADVFDIFDRPTDSYTRHLLSMMPCRRNNKVIY